MTVEEQKKLVEIAAYAFTYATLFLRAVEDDSEPASVVVARTQREAQRVARCAAYSFETTATKGGK